MPSADQIRAQMKEVGAYDKLLVFREIGYLPKILAPDERIEAALAGFYKNGNGLLVATQRRLLFVDKGLLWGVTQEEFPFSSVTSIEHTLGLVFGKVAIYCAGNRAEITLIEKAQVQPFLARLDHVRRQQSAPVAVAGRGLDMVADEVAKLEALRDRGSLTEAEFTAAKARLLS